MLNEPVNVSVVVSIHRRRPETMRPIGARLEACPPAQTLSSPVEIDRRRALHFSSVRRHLRY